MVILLQAGQKIVSVLSRRFVVEGVGCKLIWCKFADPCENSSVGRAQPCQGWGREFESRFSLKVEGLPFGSPSFILGFFPGGMRLNRVGDSFGCARMTFHPFLGGLSCQ